MIFTHFCDSNLYGTIMVVMLMCRVHLLLLYVHAHYRNFTYGSCFGRLVNGVVEKTRKKTEASIAVAADAIGIPRMLIDIRHGR